MARSTIVCVTGASGFLASWLVKRLLESGYTVRGTVRDPEDLRKTQHLRELPGADERLELFKADLLSEGVFDSIVDGCEGVFHAASAVILSSENPQEEILDPAVKGTLNVLNACKKASSVRRVVYTSSAATVRFSAALAPDVRVDESFWSSTELCLSQKKWYPLAKTLAEQAAWEFSKSNNLDLVTILPSFIVGWGLPSIPSASLVEILALLKGKDDKFDDFEYMGYVHLDDVVTAHIRAFESTAAHGRYICSTVEATNNEISELLTNKFPNYSIRKFPPVLVKPHKGYVNKKLVELLGTTNLKGLDEMFEDAVKSLKRGGHL